MALVIQFRFKWFITICNNALSNGSGNGWKQSTNMLRRNCANWIKWSNKRGRRGRYPKPESSAPKKTNKGRPIKTDAEDSDPEYYGYNETATETSAGNPRFLDLLLNIQQRRAKMLGFDAPVKIEIPGYNATTDDDKPKYDVKAIPDDMLFALADKLQSAEYQKALLEKGGRNNGKRE